MALPALLVPVLGGIISTIIEKVIPGDTEAIKLAKLELQRRSLEIEGALQEVLTEASISQARVNEKEADHPNLFVAGWRPAAGWLGVFGLAWAVGLNPIINYILVNGFGMPAFPQIDSDILLNVVLGMLGLGGFRTFEKWKGVK